MQSYIEGNTITIEYALDELTQRGIDLKPLLLSGDIQGIRNLAKGLLEEYCKKENERWTTLGEVALVNGTLTFRASQNNFLQKSEKP